MNINRPTFKDTVTRVPADWANAVTALIYDVFGLAATPAAARAALGVGTLGAQEADNVAVTGGTIDNTPIGSVTPSQGFFTVVRVEADPVEPLQVATKRYVDNATSSLGEGYLSRGGGVMQGPLALANDPTEPMQAVTKRHLQHVLVDNVVDRPIQRRRWIATAGQSDFEWNEWVRPTDPYRENFVVFRNGGFLQPGYDYSVLLSQPPRIKLNGTASLGQVIDVMYLNNLTNLLTVEATPVAEDFNAVGAWADPVNMRIGYAIGNQGENAIASSSTKLSELYLSCLVLVGELGDRAVSWVGQWIPSTAAAAAHPPTLVAVSATEARVNLPENVDNNEFYWEGRYEIAMYVDGVLTGSRLWCDTNNQGIPNLTDGLVRWGTTSTPTAPISLFPVVSADCRMSAALIIDSGARQSFKLGVTSGSLSLTLTNSGTTDQVAIPPQTVVGLELPYGWSDAFPIVPAGGSVVITAPYRLTATAPASLVFNFLGCPTSLTVALTA